MSAHVKALCGIAVFAVLVWLAVGVRLGLVTALAAILVELSIFVGLPWLRGRSIRQSRMESLPDSDEQTDSLCGPVEDIGGTLVLRIRLAEGGDKLIECARGWGHVEGDCLEIVIQPWMAEKLQIKQGTFVVVGNNSGRFSLSPRDWPPA